MMSLSFSNPANGKVRVGELSSTYIHLLLVLDRLLSFLDSTTVGMSLRDLHLCQVAIETLTGGPGPSSAPGNNHDGSR